MPAILDLLKRKDLDISFVRNLVWAISNICRFRPRPFPVVRFVASTQQHQGALLACFKVALSFWYRTIFSRAGMVSVLATAGICFNHARGTVELHRRAGSCIMPLVNRGSRVYVCECVCVCVCVCRLLMLRLMMTCVGGVVRRVLVLLVRVRRGQ